MKKAFVVLAAMLLLTIMACGGGDSTPLPLPTPLSSAKAITAFTLDGAVGTINETAKTIAVTMPYGTDVSALVATFTTTGVSVKVGSTVQTSGSTANDFTSPVTYTLTAADGSTQDYTVTVTVAPSPAKAITVFSLNGVAGTINETLKTIAVTVPDGTDVTALVATFTTTGVSVKVGSTVQTSGSTANDFTSPVTYTLTAADGSTQDYTVTVAVGWTQKADFGGIARFHAVGFSIGSKGYIGTGFDGSSILGDFWGYDPSTDTWTQKADFGGGVRGLAVGFSIGNKGYIGTGTTTFYDRKKDFWEYDPTANIWTQKADFGGTAREAAVGFSIGSKGYVGTGADLVTGNKKDFWEYDPVTNAWTRKSDVGGAIRADAVGFSIGSKGYIGTGYGGKPCTKDFWEYDPSTDTWTQKADFGGVARGYAVSCVIGGMAYVGTGSVALPGDRSSILGDFWGYDPSTDTWTQKADFGGVARLAAIGFSIGNNCYIGTGNDGLYGGVFGDEPSVNYRDFWEYTPAP